MKITWPEPFPGVHWLDREEEEAVLGVLRSKWLTMGAVTQEFEKEFAKFIGCKYSAAVNSGTAALHLSLDAIGLQPDDEVITTPMTFAASVCASFV